MPRLYYRVAVIPKEPLDTHADAHQPKRIIRDVPGQKQEIRLDNVGTTVHWKGYADQLSWALYETKEMMARMGYTIETIHSVEVADSDDQKKHPFVELPGYPRKKD